MSGEKPKTLEASRLDLGHVLRRATIWLLAGFGASFAVLLAGSYSYALADASIEAGFDWTTISLRCLAAGAAVGIVLFVAHFLWHSPVLLAKAFAAAAFGATFFGLLMLVIFTYRMATQAYAWFEQMPPLLRARNEVALVRVGSEEQAAKMNLFLDRLVKGAEAAAKEKAERLQQAKTPAEKAEIEAGAEKALLLHLSQAAVQARKEPFQPSKATLEGKATTDTPTAETINSIVPDFAIRELDERIEEPMQAELKAATKPEEKAAIENDYAELRGAKVKDLIPSLKENVLIFNKDYVKDTSAWSLLRRFFVGTPSHEPIDAGIMPALLGSIYLGLITVLCAVPLGVGAALFLEEYKRSNWFFYVLQTNINNLAGIPSIVYGIFGAFVFVELIFKPLALVHGGIEGRNTLGGGLTLGLLTLPVVIVSAQEAIRAVPQSLRHGALALGATRWQVIRGVVLPNALPGILTGTILALSRALGEAAPLVFFGALLYKTDAPSLFSDFTVLPMQIFGWTSKPDPIWLDNAAMASLVLLFTVLCLNGVSIYVRNRAARNTQW
jgi:phosphate transport system permease protein